MKKINTMSALLFQLREDSEAVVNRPKKSLFDQLIRKVAMGMFEDAYEMLSDDSTIRVTPSAVDFIVDAQGYEFQQLTIRLLNVWLNNETDPDKEDEDGDCIVMALIIPPELRVRPPETLTSFVEAETTNLLKFFYSQEFECQLGKPQRPSLRNKFPKNPTE